MCGIFGLLSEKCSEREFSDDLRAMDRVLAHRGPDDSGSWIDAKVGIGLGHRRLSILDLSPLGHQPMFSADQRYVISFNGEMYNFLEVRKSLATLGHSFRSQSDTEVLLAAISEWGIEQALVRFVGMFAFALWDRRERELLLVRDRIGIKPLYYGKVEGKFLFASELKAFQVIWRESPELDRDAISYYVRYGYVPSPLSIYRGIRKLEPGRILRVRVDGEISRIGSYWDLPEPAIAESSLTAIDRLDQMIEEAVRSHMVSDTPVGAFLSGGIDSSLVVAMMQKGAGQRVRTFTIGFDEKDYNEAPYAKRVAKHLGTDHTELYVRPEDAISLVPRIASIYDEPLGDASQIPTLLVSQLARRSVKVVLSGDGGDELFAGYNRYRYGEMADGVRKLLPSNIRFPLSRVLQAIPGLQRVGYILSLETLEDIHLNFSSLWKDDAELASLGVDTEKTLSRLQSWCRSTNAVEAMTHMDVRSYLVDDLLVKVDRASMAHSLEVRVPLLDHRVVEYAFRLPIQLKTSWREGKVALRKILYRYVPKNIVDRPKKGFELPIRHWLRGPLREWAQDLLQGQSLREEGLFDAATIAKIWNQHLSGEKNHQFRLWPILMFLDWRRHHRGFENVARYYSGTSSGRP